MKVRGKQERLAGQVRPKQREKDRTRRSSHEHRGEASERLIALGLVDAAVKL